MNAFYLKLAVVPVLSAVLLLSMAPAFSAEQNKLKPGARIAGISQQHARNDGRRDNAGYRNERRSDHRHDRRNDHRNHGRNEYRHGTRHNHNHRYTVPRYHAYPGYRHRYYNGRHYYYNTIGFYFPGYGYIHHGHRHSRHCPHWHFEGFAAGLVLGAILSH